MAFMAMHENLDDRARKKGLNANFAKFDDQNGEILCKKNLKINSSFLGKMFIRDFISEMQDQ